MDFRVKNTAETYYTLMRRLKDGDPFAYTRLGDGEMEIMLGGAGGGQLPDPKLAEETWALFNLRDSRNLLGLARHQYDETTRGWFDSWDNPRYKVFEEPRIFEHATALHAMTVHKPHLMVALFTELARRPAIYVGHLAPDWASEFDVVHVKVPEFNSYSEIDEWYATLAELVPARPLVLFAAGPAKCAAVLRLLKSGLAFQAIDLGSVVDYLSGVESRTWIRRALGGQA